MTMPITANTVNGAAKISDYKCTSAMTAVSAPGKEIPFYFRTTDSAVRNVTASLTGATADYKLLALPTTIWGQCDPVNCIDSTAGAAAVNGTLTWKVDPMSRTFARYWLMVDTPTTVDTAFGLQIACAPYCTSPYALTCGVSGSETNIVNDGTTGGPTQATKWGPAAGCDGLTGLTGPETVVTFTPKAIGTFTYELHLAGQTAGKNLSMTVLDGGTATGPACDPTAVCVTNTVLTTGFSGTRTTVGNTTPAGISFSATKGHTYFIVVDSVDAATGGGAFDLQIVGKTPAGAGCM